MTGNAPSLTHANRHASGGPDAVTPAAIGADIAGAAAAAQAAAISAAASDATTKANAAQAAAIAASDTAGAAAAAQTAAISAAATAAASASKSADTITDGSTHVSMTTAERTKLGNQSGTNTGDQTSVSGNAGTATKLATARNINGVAFDGTAAVTVTAAPTAHASTHASAGSDPVTISASQVTGLIALDTTDNPHALGTATPGTGAGGAAPNDHVHPMPSTTQLADQDVTKLADGTLMRWSATAGKFIQVPESLVGFLPNGELTMDTDTATGDSGSFGQTPSSGTCIWSYFIAKRSWSGMKFIALSTAGTAAATPSGIGAKFGLYSVAANGDLTLLDSTASITAGLTGTYTTKKVALAAQTANITAGNVYAIGVLQIGTTMASTIGAWQQILATISNVGGSRRVSSKSGLTDLPSTQADSGLGTPGWRIFATVTTS